MKLWQKLKEKEPSIDWEAHAKTGGCASIRCDDCPTGGNCDNLKEVLNSDVPNSDVLNSDVKEKQMKEVTEWDNNPREMFVWDDDISEARRMFVVYIRPITDNSKRPVLVCLNSMEGVPIFKHCAELTQRRLMTNKELSRWLRQSPDREWTLSDGDPNTAIFHARTYCIGDADKEVSDCVVVREGDEDWHQPFVEE